MIVDTRGIEITPPADWINKEGRYTLKITEIKPDGYSPDGAQKLRMFFKSSDGESHAENFTLAPNSLWRVKMLEQAVNAPEVYDLNDFIGRYTTVDIKGRMYNGKEYFDVKTFDKCALNDKLDPIPMALPDDHVMPESMTADDFAEAEELF